MIKFIGDKSNINLKIQTRESLSINLNLEEIQRVKTNSHFEKIEIFPHKKIDFLKINHPETTNIDILFTSNCSMDEIKKIKSTKFLKDINQLTIKDIPPAIYISLLNQTSKTKVDLHLEKFTNIQKTKTDDNSIISLTPIKTNLILESPPSNEILSLTIPLLKLNENQEDRIEIEEKTIILDSGSENFKIKIKNTKKEFKKTEKIKCTKLNPTIIDNNYLVNTEEIFPKITFLFNANESGSFSSLFDNFILEIQSNDPSTFTFFTKESDYSLINGLKYKSIAINGESEILKESNGIIENSKSQTLYALGDLKFDIYDNKILNITGKSKHLYADNINLNKTKWQNLGSAEKISIFTAIIGFIFFILRKTWKIIETKDY